uniref:Uncharacterized protein n=1 Tax=Caenorhabditis japonica TaxID=281687 RepID=A0A8R1J1W7_CAEJA
MDRFSGAASSSSTTATTTTTTTTTMLSHHAVGTHHHHNAMTAGTSSMGHINGSTGDGSSRTTRSAQPIVMWKGETSRKKRFG